MPGDATQRKTFYVVQAFTRGRLGMQMDMPVQARSEAAALKMAERMAPRKASVIVLARTGDPTRSEFDEPIVLRSYGSIEDEEEIPF